MPRNPTYSLYPSQRNRAHRAFARLVLVMGVVVVVAAAALVGLSVLRPRDVAQAARRSNPPGPTTSRLTVLSTWPTNGATGVDPSHPLQVVFSAPLSTTSPRPQLEPPLDGTWAQTSSRVLEFDPSVPAMPLSTEHLVVPGGAGGVSSVQGATLSSSFTMSWQVANGSALRLQQILAELGYLPLDFTRTGPLPNSPEPEVSALYDAPAGSFTWRYPNIPTTLEQAWSPGVANRMTRGAMVAFERSDQMVPYTTARAQLWPALLAAKQSSITNTKGYSYAMVSENLPESLTIWHDGTVVYTSVANTGIPSSPTPIGTFFIYLRYASQTMEGYNPNGTYYVDHGVEWINYFDGNDAIHGFIRASYGFPQSLGCTELPVANAAVAWKWLHYGTLVTISPPTNAASS